jgi:hypothetical protein
VGFAALLEEVAKRHCAWNGGSCAGFATPRAASPGALALAGLVALGGSVVQGIANYNLLIMSNFIYLALALVLASGTLDAT